QGGLDEVRVVVESLAQEFDVIDVAAAAVQLAHAATGGDSEEHEVDVLPAAAVDRRPETATGKQRSTRTPRTARSQHSRDEREGRTGGRQMVSLFIGAGRQAGIRPADLVGAIANEAGIRSRDIGAIEIADRFSLIEVPAHLADGVITAMRKATLRGQKV